MIFLCILLINLSINLSGVYSVTRAIASSIIRRYIHIFVALYQFLLNVLDFCEHKQMNISPSNYRASYRTGNLFGIYYFLAISKLISIITYCNSHTPVVLEQAKCNIINHSVTAINKCIKWDHVMIHLLQKYELKIESK